MSSSDGQPEQRGGGNDDHEAAAGRRRYQSSPSLVLVEDECMHRSNESPSVQSDDTESSSAFERDSHSAILDIDDSNDDNHNTNSLLLHRNHDNDDEDQSVASSHSRRSIDTAEWFLRDNLRPSDGLEGFVDLDTSSSRRAAQQQLSNENNNIWQRQLPSQHDLISQEINLMDPQTAKYDNPVSEQPPGIMQSLYNKTKQQQHQQQGSNQPHHNNLRLSLLFHSLFHGNHEVAKENIPRSTNKSKKNNTQVWSHEKHSTTKFRIHRVCLFLATCLILLVLLVSILFKSFGGGTSTANGPTEVQKVMDAASLKSGAEPFEMNNASQNATPQGKIGAEPNERDSSAAEATAATAGDKDTKTDKTMVHPTVMLPVSTRSRAIAAMILEFKVSSAEDLFQSKQSPSRQALKWICEDDPAQLPLPSSYYFVSDNNDNGEEQRHSSTSLFASDETFMIHQVLQRYACAVLAFSALSSKDPGDASSKTAGNEEDAIAAENRERFRKSWLSGDHVCHWHGLDCGTHESAVASGRAGVESLHMSTVVSVNLTNHALAGIVPKEMFSSAALPDLLSIDISHNQFHGGLPPLASSKNTGSHEVKTSAGHYYVHFTHNDSSIPTVSTRSALSHLELSSNLLTGTLSTNFVAELQELEYLSLERNFLSGTLPEFDKMELVELRLSDNILEGSLPDSIGHLTSLKKLWLDHNELEHSIPLSWAKLTKLELMSLHHNAITGELPTFIGSMPNLSGLWLHENQLRGQLPASLGSCTNLKNLFLDGNFFRGLPPSSLGNLHCLEKLRLYGNRLSGSMPTSICDLMSEHHLEFLSADCSSGHIQCACCNACF